MAVISKVALAELAIYPTAESLYNGHPGGELTAAVVNRWGGFNGTSKVHGSAHAWDETILSFVEKWSL